MNLPMAKRTLIVTSYLVFPLSRSIPAAENVVIKAAPKNLEVNRMTQLAPHSIICLRIMMHILLMIMIVLVRKLVTGRGV